MPGATRDTGHGVDVAAAQLPTECFPLPRLNDGFQVPYYLASAAAVDAVRPPAVVKTWPQRYAELNAEQQRGFDAFYKAVRQAPWYDAGMHDTWTCLRYLVSRSYDSDKALAMLQQSTQWRRDMGASAWTCEQCLRDANQHMSQFVGWDLQHRPVLYMSMRWGPERKKPLQHMVCVFNHLQTMMPVGVEQWVCVTDFATYSHLHDSKPAMAVSVINTLQAHYPERLGKIICVNAPRMFSFFWKLIYPVIDPVTRTKMDMVSTEDTPSAYDLFPTLFPPALCQYLYDAYERSKHNVPRPSLIWQPRAEGYARNAAERKAQLQQQPQQHRKSGTGHRDKSKHDASHGSQLHNGSGGRNHNSSSSSRSNDYDNDDDDDNTNDVSDEVSGGNGAANDSETATHSRNDVTHNATLTQK